jgi:hypothetical protein
MRYRSLGNKCIVVIAIIPGVMVSVITLFLHYAHYNFCIHYFSLSWDSSISVIYGFGGMQLKIQTDLQLRVYTSILRSKPNSILICTIELEHVFSYIEKRKHTLNTHHYLSSLQWLFHYLQ